MRTVSGLFLPKIKKGATTHDEEIAADELKVISKAVNLLSEKGIYTPEELDAALSAAMTRQVKSAAA